MNAPKAERDYGKAYAEWLHANEGDVMPVDIDAACTATVDIPEGDYRAMRDAGIDNPDPRAYWRGFNDYVAGIS